MSGKGITGTGKRTHSQFPTAFHKKLTGSNGPIHNSRKIHKVRLISKISRGEKQKPGFFFLLKHPPIFGPFPSDFFSPSTELFSPLQNFVSPPLSFFPSIPLSPLQSIFPSGPRHYFLSQTFHLPNVSITAYRLIRMRKCCRIFPYVTGGLRIYVIQRFFFLMCLVPLNVPVPNLKKQTFLPITDLKFPQKRPQIPPRRTPATPSTNRRRQSVV